jgi:hypothetical protein
MTEDCGKQTEFEDYIEHKGAQYYYDMAQEHLKERKRLHTENQRLHEALQGLLHWSHWANEKLGFGIDPLFPEYKNAKQVLKGTAE